MTLHNDIENEETTVRVKITTVLLLAWSIVSLAVIANFSWSYVISGQVAHHEKVDDARVARLETLTGTVTDRLNCIETNQLVLIKNQERVLEALKTVHPAK
jgi:hypothetical protein